MINLYLFFSSEKQKLPRNLIIDHTATTSDDNVRRFLHDIYLRFSHFSVETVGYFSVKFTDWLN